MAYLTALSTKQTINYGMAGYEKEVVMVYFETLARNLLQIVRITTKTYQDNCVSIRIRTSHLSNTSRRCYRWNRPARFWVTVGSFETTTAMSHSFEVSEVLNRRDTLFLSGLKFGQSAPRLYTLLQIVLHRYYLIGYTAFPVISWSSEIMHHCNYPEIVFF
jgi:hypothetical protein